VYAKLRHHCGPFLTKKEFYVDAQEQTGTVELKMISPTSRRRINPSFIIYQ